MLEKLILLKIKYFCQNGEWNVLHIYNSNHVYISDLLKMIPDNLIKVVSNEDFKNILNNQIELYDNERIQKQAKEIAKAIQ